MNYETLIEKVASEKINLSPAVLDVIRRTGTVGLHKVASTIHGGDVTLKSAAVTLGTQLLMSHFKQQKIAAGLRALEALEADGLGLERIKRANMFSMAEGGIKSLMPNMKTVGAPVAKGFGEMTGEVPGMFAAHAPQAEDLAGTIGKLRNEETGMGHMPSAPAELPKPPPEAAKTYKDLPAQQMPEGYQVPKEWGMAPGLAGDPGMIAALRQQGLQLPSHG